MKKGLGVCLLLVGLSALPAVASAGTELAPGFSACIKAVDKLAQGVPDNGYGQGDIREMKGDCYAAAQAYWDRELEKVVRQQKQRCGKNFTEPADQKECLKAYDDARASGERYRKAMGEALWKAYGDGSGAWMCFRCSEFSIAETKAGAQALAWDPFAQK